MNSIDIKKEDGSFTRFNFTYDNGLSYKPVIENTYKIFSFKENDGTIKFFRFILELNNNDLNKLDSDFLLLKIHLFNLTQHEYWFEFNNCYVVFKNDKKIIHDFFINNKIGIRILDSNNNIVCEY